MTLRLGQQSCISFYGIGNHSRELERWAETLTTTRGPRWLDSLQSLLHVVNKIYALYVEQYTRLTTPSLAVLPLHKEEGSGTAPLLELFFSPEILGKHQYAHLAAAT